MKDMGVLISNKYKPCFICGKLTNRIEYCCEAYICSEDCKHIADQKSTMLINKANTVLQHLVQKLDLLDEQNVTGKLDLIIQLPYSTKAEEEEKEK